MNYEDDKELIRVFLLDMHNYLCKIGSDIKFDPSWNTPEYKSMMYSTIPGLVSNGSVICTKNENQDLIFCVKTRMGNIILYEVDLGGDDFCISMTAPNFFYELYGTDGDELTYKEIMLILKRSKNIGMLLEEVK